VLLCANLKERLSLVATDTCVPQVSSNAIFNRCFTERWRTAAECQIFRKTVIMEATLEYHQFKSSIYSRSNAKNLMWL